MINEENEGAIEVIEEETEQEEQEEQEQGVDYWKAEALKNKAILDRNKNKAPKETPKSNDFGYDVKAFLKASGITSNEMDFVKEELKSSGVKEVDELLDNEYFKAKLEKHRELAKTQDAIPSGKRSGGVATDSVEYWLTKPFEEVPQDKRREVLNAKMKKENGTSQFYNS